MKCYTDESISEKSGAMLINRFLFLMAVLICLWVPAKAGTISNSSVFGELYLGSDLTHNAFDPAPGGGFLNSPPGNATVTVSNSAIEFGYFLLGFVTVDFNDAHPQLTVVYNTIPADNIPALTIRLTDTAFQGLSLVPLTDSFTNGLTSVLSGDVITLTWQPDSVASISTEGCPTCHTATFDFTSVPEPSTWVTAGAGILGLVLASRFRRSPSVSGI